MVKKIKAKHDCQLHGHKVMLIGNILTGVKKQELIIAPNQPAYNQGLLYQCVICKQIIIRGEGHE